jgi:AcrR family transcriptional regulator
MKIQQYLESTLLKLLQQKSIDNLRVTDIIDEMGISKGTFYKYYQDKYDLLRNTFNHYFYEEATNGCKEPKEFMENCMKSFRRMPSAVYNAFCSEDVNSIRNYHEQKYRAFVEEYYTKNGFDPHYVYTQYALDFYVSNVSEILLRWLKNGCKQSDEEMSTFFYCILPVSLTVPQDETDYSKEIIEKISLKK